jgi:UbiD family decarboxylase
MQQKWIETETTVDTVNWKGEPIKIENVKAFKDPETGEILAYPSEITKAEIKQIAKELGIQPRDVTTLLMLCIKPGNFNEGYVFFKYHLQKMMFYLWESTKEVFQDSLIIDNIIAAENGPVPENLDKDIARLKDCGIIETKNGVWEDEKGENHTSKRMLLTGKGKQVANEVCKRMPEPFSESAMKAKEKIYPMSPTAVRHMVHKQFPAYKDTYVKNDIE